MSSASTISKFSSALSKLSEEGRRQLAEAIRSNVATVEPYRKLFTYYPDHGPLRRELYPRHLAFFAAGGAH
jgi:hypothetical protein